MQSVTTVGRGQLGVDQRTSSIDLWKPPAPN
jgi:hypothetical protein